MTFIYVSRKIAYEPAGVLHLPHDVPVNAATRPGRCSFRTLLERKLTRGRRIEDTIKGWLSVADNRLVLE